MSFEMRDRDVMAIIAWLTAIGASVTFGKWRRSGYAGVWLFLTLLFADAVLEYSLAACGLLK